MKTCALIIGCFAVSGCFSPPDQMEVPEPDPTSVVPAVAAEPAPVKTEEVTVAGACDMTKFAFTQDTGCANDGWVEFCAVKSGGAPLVSKLRAIAPDLSIADGQIGRAGCDEAAEYHVMYRLDAPTECMGYHGALTTDSWSRLCQLAAVPETKHFVPGWGE